MNEGWVAGYPIRYWIADSNGRLKMVLEVRPFNNAHKRIEFLNLLSDKGIRISDRAKEVGKKYTRLQSDTIKINNWTDQDELYEARVKLYSLEEFRNKEAMVISALKEFDWNY